MKLISENEGETGDIAKKFAEGIRGGEIFALQGELGAGKTLFTKFFARALGVQEEVTSPTFMIMKNYNFTKKDRNLNLIHIDAYRFEEPSEARSIGFEEMLNNPDNVIVVEWPERIWSLIPSRAKLIKIEYLDENRRSITIGKKL